MPVLTRLRARLAHKAGEAGLACEHMDISAGADSTTVVVRQVKRPRAQQTELPSSRRARPQASQCGSEQASETQSAGVASGNNGFVNRGDGGGVVFQDIVPGNVVSLSSRIHVRIDRPLASTAGAMVFTGRIQGGSKNGLQVALKIQPKLPSIPCQVFAEQLRMKHLTRHKDGYPQFVQRPVQFDSDDNRYLFATELLGPDLSTLIAPFGTSLPAVTTLKVASQMVSVLGSLHQRGLCHRDVKIDNMVLGLPGSPQESSLYLIDFGNAATFEREPGRLESGPQPDDGTPHYMSLRAHQRQPLRPVDDLYSLGFSLLHLLTGSLPWAHVTDVHTKQGKHALVNAKAALVQPANLVQACGPDAQWLCDYFLLLAATDVDHVSPHQKLQELIGSAYECLTKTSLAENPQFPELLST
eukprot:CAMPEP_0114560012 /NCGR_PEP_ID=MMETSP0114-20121206/11227_1 /TAXON_ID=31324 /ORGANISM="Goniomonas sp, Strain m" /LENGTH=412 /DNA_ID=CAMNT_0001745519 /DNA_START=5 /DNA_END=1243 /DNA_ORIENTATION=+